MNAPASTGTFYAFRLPPQEDLKKGILQFAQQASIKAGAIVSCVGSLERLTIRLANQSNAFTRDGHFEILSLSGTLSLDSVHIHLAVADREGNTFGGHLLENSIVFTTAEIVIVALPGLEFARELDSTYGYRELIVKKATK